MFKDIIIGQYVPGKSKIHTLDPKIKIILTIFYIVVLFLIDKPLPYAILGLITFFVILLTKIKLSFFIKGLKPMLFIIIFTAIINLFLTKGTALWSAKFLGLTISISIEGIRAAITMFLRLVFLITGTSVLTLTTPPLMLTDGIEKLLRPLKVIKVPSHEIAMMMTIAIRFIPTLAEETEKIKKAQMSRGADFESGNIIKRAKAMIPVLVPLFVSAFRRADDLATAMDARCYNGGKGRTKLNESRITHKDIIKAAVVILALTVILILQFTIEF